MGLGQFLGNIGRAFVPRVASTSVRTPPFIGDYEDQAIDPTDEEEPQQGPSAASAMGGNAPGTRLPSGLMARGPVPAPMPPEPDFNAPEGGMSGMSGMPSGGPAGMPRTAPTQPSPSMPTPPVKPKIGLGRQIGGALIQGAGMMFPPAAPLARTIGEKVGQGSFPAEEREYERQMGIQKAQADISKEQATAEETKQRGRFYGQQADTMAAEGKRGPKGNYIPIAGGGVFDANSGRMVVQPAAKNPADFIVINPTKAKALGIEPDPDGKFRIPKEGIGAYLTSEGKPAPAPTVEGERIKFQNTLSKLYLAGELPPNSDTDSKARDKALRGSKSLTQQEIADALAWAGANPNPAAQATAGILRIEALGETKPITVIDSTSGQAQTMNMSEFNTANKLAPGRYVASQTAVPAMSKEAIFKDINYNVRKAREAINALDDMDAGTRAQLALALKDADPKSAISAFLSGSAASLMTPQQEDAVIALRNLNENAMALRQVAGMGQGSDSMRAAIQATIPSGRTPNKGFALKQLDQFSNIVQNLHTGVPGLGKPAVTAVDQTPAPTAGAQSAVSVSFGGKTYQFPNQQAADAFKREMKIQ